ncbi:hypothetical protein NQ315_003381 [Exocentrus adspersus]|uniref:Tensin n=1 Tax=Exocentrus adspersus TaxID=1586481 RepID=A0AAV8VMJ7_9CUCU|nr:hypothetical protein NQ315_003381 [Exocentrus adspersus]
MSVIKSGVQLPLKCCCQNRSSTMNGQNDVTAKLLYRIAFTIWHVAFYIENTSRQHTHDEAVKNGTDINKMLRSTSYNGYGEALTSQPRASRGHPTMSGGGMDLSYVTERIISMWFPSSTTPHSYRQGQQQASHMLRNKHGDNYMVFNLSEPKRALRSEHKHVKEVGWSHNLAPPLERLCSVCKEIDSWLSGDQHRIAVLHARGSKDKLGVIVAAYMHYSSICGNAEQALDRFSMRKFLEDNVGPLQLPSNKRYVDYFAGLLSHNIKINAAPMYLTHVTVLGAPSFQNGGCKAFLKLYEGHTPMYTSGVYSVSKDVSQFTVNVTGEGRRGLQLRGDILIKCYHRSDTGRETIFACQFHTCAVADNTLSFTRQELDVACTDPRFPIDGAVELHFSPGPEGRHPVPAPTPAVPFTLADDPVTRADSPLIVEDYDDEEDFDEDELMFEKRLKKHPYSGYTSPSPTTLRRKDKDPIDDIFTPSALNSQPLKRDFREEYYKEEVRRYDPLKRSLTEGTIRRSPEKITSYKTSNSVVTSPYSDTESLSPPGAFRNSTKSPEFHETIGANPNQTPASILAANPLGQIIRPSSRGGQDQPDSGLLSLVEQQEQYNKINSSRYNQGMVGIETSDSSPTDSRTESTRIDALNDLIANLSSGSDKSSNSPNTTSACQVLTPHYFVFSFFLQNFMIVNDQGVTLTDNKRKLFFRRHYPINTISHCGLDPDEHRWLVNVEETGSTKSSNRIFGFVARKPNVNNPDNQCHLFAELEPEQPATAIVNFLNKVLSSSGIKPNIV